MIKSARASVFCMGFVLVMILGLPSAYAKKDHFKVNFENTKLIEVVKWFAKNTDRNFIVTNSARCRVNIISNKPVTSDEAYQAFVSALSEEGLQVSEEGKFLKINRKKPRQKVGDTTSAEHRKVVVADAKGKILGLERLLEQTSGQVRMVASMKGGKGNGVKLFSIKPDSVYDRIGLKNGDVIRRVDDKPVTDQQGLFAAFRQLKDKVSTEIIVTRRGQEKQLALSVGK